MIEVIKEYEGRGLREDVRGKEIRVKRETLPRMRRGEEIERERERAEERMA